MSAASDAFIPVQRVMYSPDGAKCQVEEYQIEELKAAGFTVYDPNGDILADAPTSEKGDLANGKKSHAKAVQTNIDAQQAALAEQ